MLVTVNSASVIGRAVPGREIEPDMIVDLQVVIALRADGDRAGGRRAEISHGVAGVRRGMRTLPLRAGMVAGSSVVVTVKCVESGRLVTV